MLICISTFGTEWVTKNHQNSLYDSSANISNEDNSTRVTRSRGKHEFCQFCKGEHFQQLAVFSTVLPVGYMSKALLFHPEERWLSRGKVLKHAFGFHDELKKSLNEKARLQLEALSNDESELQTSFLGWIFVTLDELHLLLRGQNATCLDLSERSNHS